MHTMTAVDQEAVEGGDSDQDANAIGDQIEALLSRLPDTDRATVLRRLSKKVPRGPTPRAGPVLDSVVNVLPRKESWSVSEIKEAVADDGVEAKPKEIYNAISYLARRGQIKQVGYGRYFIVGVGAGLVTMDQLGLEPKEDGE